MIRTQRVVPVTILAQIGHRHVKHIFPRNSSSKSARNLKRSLQIVATSEHWWEDEEEFDALTDALRKKVIVLITPSLNTALHTKEIETLRSSLASLEINAGFCSSEELDYATELWAGRDKPPLFLKMRRRVTLDIDSTDRISQFLEEALQQNWRLDLDAGLGLEEPPAENLLVVCSGDVAESLLKACGGHSGSHSNSLTNENSTLGASPKVVVISVEGTKAGDPADWKTLSKKIVYEENTLSGQKLTI